MSANDKVAATFYPGTEPTAPMGAYALWRDVDSERPCVGLIVRRTGADLHLRRRLYRARWAFPKAQRPLRMAVCEVEDCPRYGIQGRARYGSDHPTHDDGPTVKSGEIRVVEEGDFHPIVGSGDHNGDLCDCLTPEVHRG